MRLHDLVKVVRFYTKEEPMSYPIFIAPLSRHFTSAELAALFRPFGRVILAKVIYDSVGRDTFMRSLDCLRPRGLMVSFGQSSGPVEPIAPNLLAQKGSIYLTRPTLFHYTASREQLERSASELFEVVGSGKVIIEVKQRYPLSDAAEAQRALEARQTTGSTVLTI